MKNILDTIGNTPIVKLQKIVPEGSGEVYVKLEANNPTGSKKDRMALSMIEGAEKKGLLTKGMSVVEYSGGSTGAGLAFVCGIKGYQFRLITADVFGKEKIGLMKALGADLEIIKSENGKITKELISKMIARAAEISNESGTFFTDQLNNYDVIEGFVRDGRIGHSHLNVPGHDGRYGFGGVCFPKDIQAIIHFADSHDIDMAVLKGAWETNLKVRPEKDWEQFKGRAISDLSDD